MSRSHILPPDPTLSTTPRLILGWLLCYPFQSTHHLALALGKDASVIAAHLRHLAAGGLVESLAPAWLGGRLWSLTRTGLQLLAQAVESDPAQLAKAWHMDRAARERYIAHLFSIVPVERFMLNLCVYAPAGLAPRDGGRRPAVRWHWLPDWRHRFVSGRQPRTVQADAVVIWRCEPRGCSCSLLLSRQVASDQPAQRTWQCALILYERGLENRESVRQRLARLLQYRESADRWATYQQFPPILALLKHPHHTERWLREVQALAQTYRTTPLAGAMAVLPNEYGFGSDPWRLSWKNVADGAPVRLGEVLTPVPIEAWPAGVRDHIIAIRAVLSPLAIQKINKTATTLLPASSHAAASRKMPDQSHGPAAMSVQVSKRHLTALLLLARHPLLSTSDIASFISIKEDSAARYLRELWQRDCLCAWQIAGDTSSRWWLSDSGLRLIAVMQRFSLQRLGWRERQTSESEHQTRPLLMPRALPALLRYPLHTAGVYSFLAALHRATPLHEITVSWWETGEGCERSYPWHGIRRNLRPDAEFALLRQDAIHLRHHRYWLEYDRGTMRRRDLEAKMRTYADYMRAREWVKDGLASLPRLLFVVPDTGQERRVSEAAHVSLANLPLPILVTTAGHLAVADPFAPIWRPVFPLSSETRQTMWRA